MKENHATQDEAPSSVHDGSHGRDEKPLPQAGALIQVLALPVAIVVAACSFAVIAALNA